MRSFTQQARARVRREPAHEPIREQAREPMREQMAECAFSAARRFLKRWRDPVTRAHCDDFAQEAACRALARVRVLGTLESLSAYARTIARRVRWRARYGPGVVEHESLDADEELRDRLYASDGTLDTMRIGSVCVQKHWALDELGEALCRLTRLNRAILASYYEGFSCRELAARYGLPEQSVKVRLYRGRRRVRRELEVRATSVGDNP